MNKIVLRHSRKSLIFSVMIGALGISVLAAMLPLASKDGVGPVVLVVLVGGTFSALGVYGVLKSAHDRITIYSFGIAKNSAPRGARTFQCNWEDVMDYSWTSNTGVFEARSAGASVYVLTSPKAQLRINSYSDYFPRLHSYILSRIPEGAEIHLQRSEIPKAIRCDETRDFRRSSLLGNAGNVLVFLFMSAVGAFFMITPWVDQSDWGPPFAIKLAFGTLGAFVLYIGASRLVGTLKKRTSDAIRISRSGVTAIWGGKKGRHIPWDEIKAVQYLYYLDHSDKDSARSGRRNRINLRRGSRFQYFYAIIGAEGKVMRFNSWMRDFAPFVSALVDHAPAKAGISLHDPLDKLR